MTSQLNITHRDPKELTTVEIKRYLSGELKDTGRRMRHRIESSKLIRGLLKVIGLLSVTMIISDGVLTPAQSVLGAIQGIDVVSPNISRGVIVGVTDAILVLLFLVQPLGITKITVAFSPIVLIWLGFNAAFGIYNLVHYDASVLKAFGPNYAFRFMIQHKEPGWRMLGGVLLAFTGLEALFADLGAFTRRAVQISWLCYTFPCLLLAYIGQAAYISVHPEAYDNPFFKSAPPGTIYPALVIAVLAAIVASQAIITATFQVGNSDCLRTKMTTATNMLSAPFVHDETLILSPNQGGPHIKIVSRPTVHSDSQLASDDRNSFGRDTLQKCT